MFPKSFYALSKTYCGTIKFVKFVVCQTCHQTYYTDQCVNQVGGQQKSKSCSNIQFPNHPHLRKRQPCGSLLLKTVETKCKKILYPFKVYCYQSLQDSLQNFYHRESFVSNCNLWREGTTSDEIIKDIYGGKVWQEFCKNSFFEDPYSLGFILNVDWFQPFTHTRYSVGVIYLTILNLPRHLRYKRENVILVSIMPGPHEPPREINSYLQPLVKELQQFWKGVKLSVFTSNGKKDVTVRGAILCVSCDLPAGHKTCGFLGHSAKLGCSKCLKEFPGEIGNRDYSGFDHSSWPKRNKEQHKNSVDLIRKCKTKTKTAQKESSKGCRYSCLIDLPYFDAPRMLCIDPMHNLFLGTAKHMISLWIDNGLLSKADFTLIQCCIDNLVVPSDIGQIPQKIESGFSSFKADQFKSWVNIYSIPALIKYFAK